MNDYERKIKNIVGANPKHREDLRKWTLKPEEIQAVVGTCEWCPQIPGRKFKNHRAGNSLSSAGLPLPLQRKAQLHGLVPGLQAELLDQHQPGLHNSAEVEEGRPKQADSEPAVNSAGNQGD